MKMKILFVIASTFIGLSRCANEKSFLNKEGMASNTNTDTVVAVSYALAKEKKTDDFYVQNSKDFKNPELVEKLPPKVPLGGGAIETIDELPSAEDYYDGTRGLKMSVTTCTQYSTKQDVCLHQGSCGWCGASGSCIPGNNLGPLAPCLRGSYVFTSPQENWNPLPTNNVQVSRTNLGGAQLTTVIAQ